MLNFAFEQTKKCQATLLKSGLAFFCFGALACTKSNKLSGCYLSIVGAIEQLKPGRVTQNEMSHSIELMAINS